MKGTLLCETFVKVSHEPVPVSMPGAHDIHPGRKALEPMSILFEPVCLAVARVFAFAVAVAPATATVAKRVGERGIGVCGRKLSGAGQVQTAP